MATPDPPQPSVHHDRPDATLQLPAEILSCIFEEHVQGHLLPVEAQKSWHYIANFSLRFFRAAEAKEPLLLGSICRRWREVAWADPRLWSTLTISLDAGAKYPMAHTYGPELVSQWLGRTGNLPLRIRLEDPATKTSPHRQSDQSEAQRNVVSQAVVREITAYSSRWHSLDLDGLPFAVLNQIGADIERDGTSILQRISIQGNVDCISPPFSFWQGFAQRHRPTHIAFVGGFRPSDFDINWGDVTHVYADRAYEIGLPHGLFDFCALSSITHLVLSSLWSEEYPDVELPQLLHLSIVAPADATEMVSAALLDALTVPSLQTFHHMDDENIISTNFPANALIRLVGRSNCAIEDLILLFPLLDDHGLFCILQSMPSITHLELRLRDENKSTTLFANLSPALAETSGMMLLPLLKRLDITARAPKPWSNLIAVFNHQRPPPPQQSLEFSPREDMTILFHLKKEPDGDADPCMTWDDLLYLVQLWVALRCLINIDDDYNPEWSGACHIFSMAAARVCADEDPVQRGIRDQIEVFVPVHHQLWGWLQDGGGLPVPRPAFRPRQDG